MSEEEITIVDPINELRYYLKNMMAGLGMIPCNEDVNIVTKRLVERMREFQKVYLDIKSFWEVGCENCGKNEELISIKKVTPVEDE